MQIRGLSVPHFRANGCRKMVPAQPGFTIKLTALLLLTFLVQAGARTMAQTVSYTGKSVTLKEVFTAIKKQTGYKFFYRNEDLADAGKVTVSVKNVSIDKALQLILADKPLQFMLEGKTVFISRKKTGNASGVTTPDPQYFQQTTGDVSGAVKDPEGKPIAGATVMLKQGRSKTVTNEQGEFMLHQVNDGDTLVFSSIGFKTASMPAGFTGRLIVLMHPQVAELADIVVYNTGYQQLSKERATGAFGKPDMEIFQNRVATNDIMSRLDGQIAGLTVMSGSFTANQNNNGVKTNKTVIRGISSVNQDSDPLYVVNGVIVSDFSTVNPQDVEDITVLKDAAASAIYGARATNGVIVVRTREGHKNQMLQLTYSGNVSFQGKPDFNYIPMMTSAQFIQSAKETFSPQFNTYESYATSSLTPHSRILFDEYRGIIGAAEANRKLDSLASISNASQIRELFFRNAVTGNHTLSAAGGTENYSFYASLSYTGSQGNTPGQKDNTCRINITQNVNAGKRVSLSLNTSLINNIITGDGTPYVPSSFLPYQLFQDAAGNDINLGGLMGLSDSLREDHEARSRVSLDYYPLQEHSYAHKKTNNLFMNVTGNVSVKLLKGLNFQGTYGYIKSPGINESYTDAKSFNQRQQLIAFTIAPTVNDEPKYLLPTKGGNYVKDNTDQRNWTVRNQLVYAMQPGHGRDMLTLQAGQEAQENVGDRSTVNLYGYNEALGTSVLIDYITLRQGVFGTIPGYSYFIGADPYSVSEIRSRYQSYFALGSYTFNHKYSLDVSWRRDHSTLFGSDVSAQNKPTYSFGAKWQLHKESFLQKATWVNELGLRVTYGITGNSPYVGAGSSQDVLRASPQSASGGIAGDALVIDKMANRKLTWEATRTINIGTDFSFLSGRLSGTVNLYHRSTSDLLTTIPINRFTGAENMYGNLGNMINQGIEWTLRTQNIQGKDFGWYTSFVFAHNRNKLVSFGEAINDAYFNSPTSRVFTTYVQGQSMFSLYAYRYAGLDNMGDPQIRLADNSVTKKPYVATASDMVYMGTYQPVFNGGFTNAFRYKSLSLTVNMVYSLGHVMRTDINELYDGLFGENNGLNPYNFNPAFLNRWKKPGDENHTNVPAYEPDFFASTNRRSIDYYRHADINVVSASYLKVRDVTLSYNLGTALQFLKINNAGLSVQATNFMIWKANDRGIDPEFINPKSGQRTEMSVRHSYNVALNITL